MRLLMVGPGLYPQVRGGTEKHLHDLATEFSRRHQVSVFVTIRGAYSRQCEKLYTIETAPEGRNSLWTTERALLDAIRRLRPDVIYFHHWIGLNALLLRNILKRADIPFVISLQDYWSMCRDIHLMGDDGTPCRNLLQCPGCRAVGRARLLKKAPIFFRSVVERSVPKIANQASAALSFPFWFFFLRRRAERSLVCAASATIVNSYRVQAIHNQYGFALERMLVNYQGIPTIETTGMHSDGAPSPVEDLQVERRLLFLGRINGEKGVDTLLAARRHIRSVKQGAIVLAGSCSDDWRRRIEKAGDGDSGWRVEITGAYTSENLPSLARNVDAVVVPSIWEEPYALTVEEARRLGHTLVASDTGGLSERVRDGVDGFLFQRGDARSLARVLDRLFGLDPEEIRSVRQRGRDAATSIEGEVNRLETLLQTVADRKSHAAIRRRFAAVLPALCELTGRDDDTVLDRLRLELAEPGRTVRDAWNAANPKTGEEIERFYATTDAYLFDLLVCHETWERKMWTKSAVEIFVQAGAKRLLDYGGGCGDDSLEFQRYLDQVTLLEPGELTSALARKRLAQFGHIQIISTLTGSASEEFDAVYCTEVLEHVPDPLALMATLYNALRPGGVAVVTHSFGLVGDQYPSHLRAHSVLCKSFLRDISTLGFDIERIKPLPGNRFYVLRRRAARRTS